MGQAGLGEQFARCWPWLEPALKRGGQGRPDRAALLAVLHANQATLWPGDDGAMVTQLVVTPEGRFLHVWLAGGSLEALMGLRPGVEAWGRAQGAEYVSIHGRQGWARLLEPFGYRRDGEELVKKI